MRLTLALLVSAITSVAASAQSGTGSMVAEVRVDGPSKNYPMVTLRVRSYATPGGDASTHYQDKPFYLRRIPVGLAEICVTADGYHTIFDTVTIAKKSTPRRVYVLQPDAPLSEPYPDCNRSLPVIYVDAVDSAGRFIAYADAFPMWEAVLRHYRGAVRVSGTHMPHLYSVAVFVTDIDRALLFYRDHLGLPLLRQGSFGAEFLDGETRLGVHPAVHPDSLDARRPPHRHHLPRREPAGLLRAIAPAGREIRGGTHPAGLRHHGHGGRPRREHLCTLGGQGPRVSAIRPDADCARGHGSFVQALVTTPLPFPDRGRHVGCPAPPS